MLGLVVTPTTLYSSTSDCRLPLRMRSRDRSSSQTATPALDSCARFSFWAMTCPLSVFSVGFGFSAVAGGVGEPATGYPGARGGRGTRGGGLDALAGGRHDGVGRHPELLVPHGQGRARAVVVQADDPPGAAHELPPAHRHTGLDGHARLDRRRQHLLAVRL